MPISKIHARQIFDSRGNPTVEVDLYTERGMYQWYLFIFFVIVNFRMNHFLYYLVIVNQNQSILIVILFFWKSYLLR